jgi:GNAT superfamily N-acetyltransferase
MESSHEKTKTTDLFPKKNDVEFFNSENFSSPESEDVTDISYINTEKHFSYSVKDGDFEHKKAEFKRFCSDFLNDVYDGIKKEGMIWDNEITQMIIRTEDNPKKNLYRTQEGADLVEIFLKEIKKKSEDIFFSEEFDAEKDKSFHTYIKSNFLSGNPNITDSLKFNFYNYLLVQGDLRDTGILNYATEEGSGDITLAIGAINLDTTFENMNELNLVEKVSLVKTLGGAARWALSNGDWAHNAYTKSKEIIEELVKESNPPLLNSVIKYQLNLINETGASYNKIPFSNEVSDFREDRLGLFLDITKDNFKHASRFDIEQTKSPFHKNLKMVSVSRDYVSLVNGINSSVALIKDNYLEDKTTPIENLYAEIFNYIDQGSFGDRDTIGGILEENSSAERKFSSFKLLEIQRSHFHIKNGDDQVVALHSKRLETLNQINFLNFRERVKKKSENKSHCDLSTYDSTIKENSDLISTVHSPEILWSINRDFDIKIQDMYLDEQVKFIEYLSGAKTENWSKLELALKNNTQNKNILKSFLSLDQGGPEMGKKILEISEKIPTESANAIFTKYAEIIDIARDIENFVISEFDDEIVQNPKIIDNIKTKLLKRGVEVLNIFHSKIDGISDSNAVKMPEIIKESLSKISANALATLSTFKYAREHGIDIELQDIARSEFKHQEAASLDSKDQQDMIQIYKDNYQNKPEVAKELIEKFTKVFEHPEDNELYTYRIDGEMQAFVRFERFNDGKFASALNVAPEAQGFALGEAMMSQALAKEAHKNILYAEADISGAACTRYLDMGFIGVGSIEKYPGVPAIEIVWDNEANTRYLSRNLTREKIILGECENSLNTDILILDTVSDFDREELREKILTHSFWDIESSKHYIVLEKK